MCSFKFASQLFFVVFMLSASQGFRVINYQNDLSSDDDEVKIFKDEIEPEELEEVKVDDTQAMTMKVLAEVQKKIRDLEENEKMLRNELLEARSELKKKKEEEKREKKVSVILESKKEEKEVEGFWATICRIGKGILGSILGFFGIRF